MYTIDFYKRELKSAIDFSGAFLRVDRGNALLVTDILRIKEEGISLPPGYIAYTEGGLMHITPIYDFAPESLASFVTLVLKADGRNRDRLIRQRLALSLRLKNSTEIRFLTELAREAGIL